MPRKMIVTQPKSPAAVLSEEAADDEAELQHLLKDNPELLAVEEFGLTGPLMVVGEETSLPSGAVDIVGLTRDGAVVVLEFKTGPQNPDFRHAIAQLLDYGSDLWRMTIEEFESAVVARYLGSDRCRTTNLKGAQSLDEAAMRIWPDMTEEERSGFKDHVATQLANGTFHYVLCAQRIIPTTVRTIDYLNQISRGPRFFAVEFVRFRGTDIEAFESRTVAKPQSRSSSATDSSITETKLLSQVDDLEYRAKLRDFLAAVSGLGLRIEWGSVGCSIRLPTPYRPEPITVAWLFPPNQSGWMGLTDLTLGFDKATADRIPEALPHLETYAQAVSKWGGVEPDMRSTLEAYRLPPRQFISQARKVVDLLAELADSVRT